MNTIKRLRNEANLTEQQLADEVGVTKDYIVKLENTLYANASPFVVNFLAKELGLNAIDIHADYDSDYESKAQTWLEISRDFPELNWVRLHDTMCRMDWTITHDHPHLWFRRFVANYYDLPDSQIKWAQYMGIHPASLSKYELTKTANMPSAIRRSLSMLGLPVGFVTDLKLWGKMRHDDRKS